MPLLTVVSTVFARRIKSASKQLRASEGELASTAQEMLSTISLVQVYGRGDGTRSGSSNGRAARRGTPFCAQPGWTPSSASPSPSLEALGIAIVILVGARLVTSGALSAGALVAFILLIQNMFKPIRRIIKQWNKVGERLRQRRAGR